MNSDTLICIWILLFPIGIIEISTPRKMIFITLFQFLKRLLTSKLLKLFSTYLEGRNGAMWNLCFSAPQNAKKDNHLKHKNQVPNTLLLTVRTSSMKDYTCHYGVSTKGQMFTINSIKIMRIWKFFDYT
jgi:hypothetical protein